MPHFDVGAVGRKGLFRSWTRDGAEFWVSVLKFFAQECSFETGLARPYVVPRRASRWRSPHSPRKDIGGRGEGNYWGWCPCIMDEISLLTAKAIPIDVIALSARPIFTTNSFVKTYLIDENF